MRIDLAGIVLLLAACGGSSDPTGETGSAPTGSTGLPTYTPYNPCGEITYHTVDFQGIVLGVGGQPQSGARVELQDFTFQPPTVLGTDNATSGDGSFQFTVQRVKSIEDCWGNGRLDYRVVATLDDSRDEERINNAIFNAIFLDKDKVVDLSTPPLRLQ